MSSVWAALRTLLSPPGDSTTGEGSTFSAAGWLLGDRVLRMAIGLVIGVWLPRYLGADQYGTLSYAIAFAGLFLPIATLGLDSIVVRELVKTPESEGETVGTAFVLKAGGGLGATALAWSTLRLVRPDDAQSQQLVAILAGSVVFASFDSIDFWFQSKVALRPAVIGRSLATLAISFVRIALILMAAPLLAFAWITVGETALVALALLIVYQLSGGRISAWRLSLARARQLLADSWPLVLSTLVVMLYMRIDQIMLGQMVSTSEVGVYSVAVRLSETWTMIPSAIVGTWLPSIVAAKASDDALFWQRLQRLYNVMALIAYVAAIPSLFLAGPVVRLLFGPAFARAAPMLVVLLFAGVFINVGMARSNFLTAMNWPKTHFATVVGGALINIVLNLLLIPHYKGMGAAIASLISYWFAAHGACLFSRRLHRTGWMLAKAIIWPRVW